VNLRFATLTAVLTVIATSIPAVLAQSADLKVPKSIQAGAAFSIDCPGSGNGTVYIVGPSQAIKRDIRLGQTIWFPEGSLYNAGHYTVVVSSESSSSTGSLDVVPVSKPSELTFIAKPSRLPVAQHGAITGTVYVFDSYKNLITQPMQIAFQLSNPSAPAQTRTVETRNGAASTEMDSTSREGKDTFVARIGDVSSTRVVGQVPGDPCTLKVNAKPAGGRIALTTDPVRDCSGNAVPDGTIVTFTELYDGTKSSVDVPLKKDVATVSMPAHRGATISVASGVVLGNQIRWDQ
jgi:hypothetical protein